MGIDLWRIPNSPDERSAERIRGLERDLAAKRRNSQVPGVQRAHIFTATIGPFNAITTVASAAVQVPSANSLILIQWQYGSQQTVAGDNFYTLLQEATDFAGGVPLQTVSNGSVALVQHMPVVPWVDKATGAVNGMSNGAALMDPYFTQQATPTPGARTYNLKVQRLAGTGNITLTNVFFNVIVL